MEAAYFKEGWRVPHLEAQATMAVDLPELYVVGAASDKAALELGREPNYIALLNARERTASLANFLDVRVGYESLAAAYPTDASADVRGVGLATTFSGDYRARRQNLETDSDVHFMPVGNNDPANAIPISIPDKETTIETVTTAEVIVAGDALRLETEVESNDLTQRPSILGRSLPDYVERRT